MVEKAVRQSPVDAQTGPPSPSGEPQVPEPETARGTAADPGPRVTPPPVENAEPRATSEPGPGSCPHCGAETPSGAQSCPSCHLALPGNTLALKHGLRSARLAKQADPYRVELLDLLYAERGGRDAIPVVGRIACENYALLAAQHRILEARLDADGALTSKGARRAIFDMLRSLSETLNRLRETLPPVVDEPKSAAEYAAMSDEELHGHIEHLFLESAARLDAARTAGGPDGQAVSSTEPAPNTDARASRTKARSTPAPRPTCSFCRKSPDGCARLQADRLDLWRALHMNHPDEVARRQRDATAEMFHQVARGR